MWSLFLIIYLGYIWVAIMTWFVVKNRHRKSTGYSDIGLCAQNISTILDLVINPIGITWKET